MPARSAIGIIASVILQRVYPNAPISSLYFEDRLQDLAYEKDEGRTAHRHHHIRLWELRAGQWVSAATYDRGVGLALLTLQLTHHIGPQVDAERDAVGTMLERNGAHDFGARESRNGTNLNSSRLSRSKPQLMKT